jgi:mono/diheme cytochrome c family protein
MNYLLSIQVVATPLTGELDGEAIFKANCAICHGATASGAVGPNLTIEFQRNAEQAIADIIKKGRLNMDRPSMPAWGHLGEDAIDALVNFIKSIQVSPEESGA